LSKCQRKGCQAAPTRVPVIEMRLHRVFKNDAPWQMVIGLELCDEHAKAVEGVGSELLADEANQTMLRKLNYANMKRGAPAYDLARTTVVTVPLEHELYQRLLATRKPAAA
jgi:hypothetical protein